MATVTFRLDNPTNKDGSLKNEEVAIRVCLYVSKSKRPDLSSRESINPKHWNKEKSTAKATLTGHTKLNLRLLDIQRDLLELWKANKDANREELKSLISIYLNGKPEEVEKKNNAFSDFVNGFIESCKGLRSPGTLQSYRVTLAHLENYAKSKRFELSFNSITQDFYKSFTAYCWDTLKHSDNTVGKSIKVLKVFMDQAFDEDLHTNLSYKKKKFKKLTAETDEIYLTEQEILKIYSLDFHGNKYLCEVRDLFVFACWTGLRFGDLCKVRPEHIQQLPEGKIIRIHTEKTEHSVIIPFHPLCEAIYSLYNHNLPPIKKADNPRFNAALKVISEKAGLIQKQQSRTTIRGKATFEYLHKWQMVSAHTARRSFATNCYLMNVPALTIMAVTGHRTEKAFLKYIRISKDQHAKILMGHFNSLKFGEMRKAL